MSPARVRATIIAALARMTQEYGPQGWWPVYCEKAGCFDAAGALESDGYHVAQFEFPRTRRGRWEICCGAVLTQNTAWTNVRTALAGLRRAHLVTPERILSSSDESLREAIRPARYFNQKAYYVRALADWFIQNDRAIARIRHSREVLDRVRPELLKVRGIGRETADAILLYAYALPTFVVDAYTRRVFAHLGVLDDTWSYERVRALFESVLLQSSPQATVETWQESHALIVEHARRSSARKSVPIE
jgi:endonuclease-3 related protein